MVHLIKLLLVFLPLFSTLHAVKTEPPPPAPFIPEQPLSSPTEAPAPEYEHTFLKMLFALVVLIAAIFLTLWLLRRLSQARWIHKKGERIKIIERRPLSQKSALYLIEVGGKRVLIAESQLEVRRLTDLEIPIEEE
jgi:flagellar biogenesis protein FliO